MARFHSLRWKLVGSYLFLVAAVLLVVLLLTRYSVRSIFVSYQQTILSRQGQILAGLLGAEYSRSHDWRPVAAQLTNLTRLTRSEIWVTNLQGVPVLIQPPFAPASDRPTTKRLTQALRGSIDRGEDGSPLGTPELVWVALPIRADGAIVGALYLIATPSSASARFGDSPQAALVQSTQDFLASVEQRLAVIGIAVGLVAVLFGVALARSITDPIAELRRAVGRIAAGDLAQRVTVRTGDEVGALAEDVNRMAGRLETDVAELRRQHELRRDLVANVSHDLATPLTGIQGFTEALMDGVVTAEDERAELYNSIFREVLRLRRLVGDLQDLSAFENGLGHMQPQPLALAGLVEEALHVESAEAGERGVELRQEIPPDLPPLMADGDRITQVLFNLLDNALRYTPAGGTITVRARRQAAFVEVTVADTGSGIPEDQLPQVFERFYRVDRSRSRATGGGGLGLAIVKAIITAHGGQVAAASTIGRGTEMRFTLPIAPEAPSQQPIALARAVRAE